MSYSAMVRVGLEYACACVVVRISAAGSNVSTLLFTVIDLCHHDAHEKITEVVLPLLCVWLHTSGITF